MHRLSKDEIHQIEWLLWKFGFMTTEKEFKESYQLLKDEVLLRLLIENEGFDLDLVKCLPCLRLFRECLIRLMKEKLDL